MDLHKSLSLVFAINSDVDALPFHEVRLSKIVSLCLPLSRLPSVLPVVTMCSKHPSLTTYPKHDDCLFLILMINNIFIHNLFFLARKCFHFKRYYFLVFKKKIIIVFKPSNTLSTKELSLFGSITACLTIR